MFSFLKKKDWCWKGYEKQNTDKDIIKTLKTNHDINQLNISMRNYENITFIFLETFEQVMNSQTENNSIN